MLHTCFTLERESEADGESAMARLSGGFASSFFLYTLYLKKKINNIIKEEYGGS